MLVMQEQMGAFRNDNFTITDAAGRPFFNLQAASLSFTDSRQLLDVYNNPVLQMQKKVPSLRGSWLINRATDRVRVATVRPSTFSFTPCRCCWDVMPCVLFFHGIRLGLHLGLYLHLYLCVLFMSVAA